MPRRSKPTRAELQLRAEADKLTTTICCLRRELENRDGAVGRLEIVLRERLQRVDELNAKIEQLRDQNKRLDAENDHLVEMLRLPLPLIAS